MPAVTDRLPLLLQSTGEGGFGTGLSGRCTFVNHAVALALGCGRNLVLGHNLHELVHYSHADGGHYPQCDCLILTAFCRGLACHIDDEVLWRADGSSFPAAYSSYPVIANGVAQGALVTFVDITERKYAEALLERTNDKLERRVAEQMVEAIRRVKRGGLLITENVA